MLQAIHDEIDEPLEDLLLMLTGECPISRVGRVALVIREGIAEQIFQAALASEGIAFQVEKDISGVGSRSVASPNPDTTGKSS